MEIRAIEGETIRVPVDTPGEVVYLSIQNMHVHRHAIGNEAAIDLPGRLNFGNGREREGEVWTGKRVHRLVVERRHGN